MFIGDKLHVHDVDVQPNQYRAPEVILQIPWNLYQNRDLFRGIDPEQKEYSSSAHLAQIISLLGPPRVDFTKRGQTWPNVFSRGR